MLNMGAGELVLVAIIALLVIPPKKIPQVATTLGRWLSQLQKSFQELKSGVQSQLIDSELKADLNKLNPLKDLQKIDLSSKKKNGNKQKKS